MHARSVSNLCNYPAFGHLHKLGLCMLITGGPRKGEEEEGLFKANAVIEKDPERDRATQV